uniref:Uncharacterized protein n=1 Tax=Anguilla anguilla TaxID=7936 RepID=A0A0E9RAR4_ANGAN
MNERTARLLTQGRVETEVMSLMGGGGTNGNWE